jgi:hypothetical protein
MRNATLIETSLFLSKSIEEFEELKEIEATTGELFMFDDIKAKQK